MAARQILRTIVGRMFGLDNNGAPVWNRNDGTQVALEVSAGVPTVFTRTAAGTEGTYAFAQQSGGDYLFDNDIVVPKTSGVGIKVDTASPTFGWRDIIGDVSPKASGVGSPARAAYAGANIGVYAFALNDVCDFTFHIPHDYVPGTDIYFHVHWSHNGTSISGTAEFTVYHMYAKGHNQANFPAEKTQVITVSTPDLATVPQYRHRVDEVAVSGSAATSALMDRSLIEVDGIFDCTLKLTQIPTLGGGGKLFIHTCDLHYQSNNMATKARAPGFYT